MDSDFTDGWSREVGDDADNVISRTGMVIMYANCTVYWHSSLKMEIALSTSEAEYITLYYALREVLLKMKMREEINEVFPIHIPKSKFVCKVH